MPYRYLEEIATADVAFEAWGETVEGMFSAAADALLNIMVDEPAAVAPRQSIAFSLEHEELDLLLFSFLEELVFQKDSRRLMLRVPQIGIAREEGYWRLSATASGEMLDPPRHHPAVDVKAITLYRFSVVCSDGRWTATVVVDI